MNRPDWTLAELLRWCREAPDGTRMDVGVLADILDGIEDAENVLPTGNIPDAEPTWRERLWTVPAETRIGVSEVAEALGKPKSWIYARTGKSADVRIPHSKLDGSLVFKAGEVRRWIEAHEITVARSIYAA